MTDQAATTAPAGMPAKNTRRVVIVVVCAFVIYVGFALFSDIHKLQVAMSDYAWWTFAAALGLAFGNYLLRFLKWQYYLRVLDVRDVSTTDSFLTFVSGFVLSITPGKLGEMFKSFVLYKTHGVPAARTAPIVIAERLTDLVGVIAIIVASSAGFRGGLVWAGLGSAVVACILVVIASRRISMWMIGVVEWMPGPGKRLGPKIREAYDSLHALTRPKHLVLPTILSVVAWSLECLALWVILHGFHRVTSVLGASFVYATSTLVGALIPVPGGLGVTEPAMKGLMQQLSNVDPATATGAMILVRFATLWFALIVGFAALSILKRRHPVLLR